MITKLQGPVLKYPGAKWSMADWIICHMPPHRVYEDAGRFLVRMHMGYGSKTSDRTGWRNEPNRKGRNSSLPRLWKNLPARILAAVEK